MVYLRRETPIKVSGRRFHIAGSASKTVDRNLLAFAHSIIAQLTAALLHAGGSVLIDVGKEPLQDESDSNSPSIIFNWTVLEQIGSHLKKGGLPRIDIGPLVATVASSKTESQIPEPRRDLWEQLKRSGAVMLEFLDTGWSSGAVRRQRQARLGDVLVVLSGSEGVEHLAQVYVQAGKPVIPLDLDLGGSTPGGSGGAARLYGKALSAPREFVRVEDTTQAGVLLADLRTEVGKRPPGEVVEALLRLVEALAPPTVFYVRLLNPEVEGFAAVERFFRNVVDPTVSALGYSPFEAGRNESEYAWMNEEIFDVLHHSSIVVVDVTALRNNCFMELGYALGHAQRVIVTAIRGTRLPFDSEMILTHPWDDATDNQERQQAFKEWWLKHINRPPLVRPRRIL
jgi:hypothetical protein